MIKLFVSAIMIFTLLVSQENGEAYLVNHFGNSVFGEDVNFNDLAFTKNGLMYIASSKGIIEFDGKQWKIISIEDQKINSLVADTTDRVYFISDSKFGFIERDNYGYAETKLFNSLLNKSISDFRKIHITEKDIFFLSSKYIVIYNLETKTITSVNARKRILDSYLIDGIIYIRSKERGLEKFLNNNFITINDSEYFTSFSPVYNILKMDGNSLLFSRLSKLYLLNGETIKEFKTNSSDELKKHIIAEGMVLKDDMLFVPTLTGGLFQLRKNGSLIRIYNKGHYLLDDNIINTRFDQNGNFWLIHKQNFSRIGIKDNFIQITENEGIRGKINDLIFHNSKNYLAGENGVYFKKNDGSYKNLSNSKETAWSFFKFQKKLFVTTVSGIYEVTDLSLKNISKLQGQKAVPSLRNSEMIYVASSIGLAYLIKKRRSYEVGIEKKIKEHITDI
jgi:AraC family transcriptional regulator, chitin signaling transcriptional activator